MRDKNLIIVVGNTGSGKSTVLKALNKLGYEIIVPYTTRPLRKGEQQNKDYHFVTEDVFLTMLDFNEFAEYAEYDALFGHVYYGSTKKDLLKEGKRAIASNPEALKMIRESGIPHTSILLDVSVDELIKRASSRGDALKEVERRIKTDAPKFEALRDNVDIVIDGGTVDEVVDTIISAL